MHRGVEAGLFGKREVGAVKQQGRFQHDAAFLQGGPDAFVRRGRPVQLVEPRLDGQKIILKFLEQVNRSRGMLNYQRLVQHLFERLGGLAVGEHDQEGLGIQRCGLLGRLVLAHDDHVLFGNDPLFPAHGGNPFETARQTGW